LSWENNGGVWVVAIEGQINGANSPELEKRLLAKVEEEGATRMALDFSRVDYISSAGLRVVLLLAKKLSGEAGGVALFGMQPGVFEVFEMCGFADILTIVDSLDAALDKLR